MMTRPILISVLRSALERCTSENSGASPTEIATRQADAIETALLIMREGATTTTQEPPPAPRPEKPSSITVPPSSGSVLTPEPDPSAAEAKAPCPDPDIAAGQEAPVIIQSMPARVRGAAKTGAGDVVKVKEYWSIEELVKIVSDKTPITMLISTVNRAGKKVELVLERNVIAISGMKPNGVKLTYQHPSAGEDLQAFEIISCADEAIDIQSIMSRVREHAKNLYKPRPSRIQAMAPVGTELVMDDACPHAEAGQ